MSTQAPDTPSVVRRVLLICAGALVSPLDSAVNVAFPAIIRAFSVSPRDIQWVVVAFVLTQSIASLVCGRLGDVYGHRRLFIAGLVASAAAHWAVAQAGDFTTLVMLRAVQGVAVGVAIACAPALVSSAAGPVLAPRMLVLYAAVLSAGTATGPLLGGLLVERFDWSGVFLIRTVLSVVVLLLAARWLLTDKASSPPRPTHEARSTIAWSELRSRRFVTLQAAAVVIHLVTFSILLWIPFLLADWSGLSVAGAGLVLTAFPAGTFAASLLATKVPWPPGVRYSDLWMRRGQWLTSAGLIAAATCTAFDSLAALAGALFVSGAGLGCFQAGYLEQTMRWLPADNRGLGGSLFNVTRLIGLVLGVLLLSAFGDRFGTTATLAVSGVALFLWTQAYGPKGQRD